MDQLTKRFFAGSKASIAVIALVCADMLALISALVLSLCLKYDNPTSASALLTILYERYQQHHISLLIALVIYVAIFAYFRLYRYAWRFASLEMLWGIIAANTLGSVGMIFLQYLLDKDVMQRSVLVIFWLLSITLVGGMRILLRLANMSRSYGRRALALLQRDLRPKRVIILGGGADGARLLAALREETSEPYDAIGFLDDMPYKRGIYIRGVRVLGPLKHLHKLLAEHAVDEVLIALPEGSGGKIREYVMACRKQQVPVKVLPGLRDVLNGKARARLEEISVEDLLRRQPNNNSLAKVGCVTGRRVLVTGAGGSIGSELCRQILALNPNSLVLMGHGENSIHQVHAELVSMHPEMRGRIHMVIGSVSDDVRIDQIFQTHRPQVVFHAAAHKHVPIMELNMPEAIQNNVMGTWCVSEACGRYNVDRMVLISTDKAVYPSSVMGATKWLAEEVVRSVAQAFPKTAYITVRFGNVLGSRGSVVPMFKEQIKRGGPVTVTHPEMTRYFMTIPEAVHLVLQAGTVGKSGDLYLLDMGEPVRILDLARDMIRLSGLEPDTDIPIVFTGLRPGEKLHEQLVMDDELLEPHSLEGLSIVHRRAYFVPAEFRQTLRQLQQLAGSGDSEALADFLSEVVPAFSRDRRFADAASASDLSEVSSPAIPSFHE